MKFAKVVFWVAAIWGVLSITPLYFLFEVIGRKDPPPITHPGFYYGFVGTALAWQLVFFVIARDPVRHRPLMIPSIFEKFSYVGALVTLVSESRTHSNDLIFAVVDGLLGILFMIAFFKTKGASADSAAAGRS
jgi:hypothetical protein